jgi:hypothetical protein
MLVVCDCFFVLMLGVYVDIVHQLKLYLLMFYLFICYFLQPFASIQNPHGFEFVVAQVFSDIHQW